MKKIIFLCLALTLLVSFSFTTSNAITIGFDPVAQDVMLGDSAIVNLFISGLGSEMGPSLSTFDLDVSFDPLILGFNSVSFGDPVLGDQLDLFGLGSIIASDASIPGFVNLFELSLDLPDDLNALQADNFILASLAFDTLALGTSPLGIAINGLGDAFGDPLDADIQSGSVSVVPEPSTFLLVASGLAGIGFFVRRKYMP
jgi:hypothetical protein